jgi:hypothetical protein
MAFILGLMPVTCGVASGAAGCFLQKVSSAGARRETTTSQPVEMDRSPASAVGL